MSSSTTIETPAQVCRPKLSSLNRNRIQHPISDSPGDFCWVSKYELNIDQAYQRDHLSQTKISEIRQNFSWKALLVLGVSRRSDGTLWVFEGQHRLLAAMQRNDVSELPCVVFDAFDNATKQEAEAFLAVNTVRSTVKAGEKLKALREKGDPAATQLLQDLSEVGYRYKGGGGGKRSVGCIGVLLYAYNEDPVIARKVLQFHVELADGDYLQGDVLEGLFHLEHFQIKQRTGESIFDAENLDKLRKAGLKEIEASINETRRFYVRGGAKVFANAIGRVINKSRRTHFLPIPSLEPNG